MSWFLEHFAILIAAAVALGSVFVAGHSVGTRTTQSKADADKLKATDEQAAKEVATAAKVNDAKSASIKVNSDVQNNINKLPNDASSDELRTNWNRDQT